MEGRFLILNRKFKKVFSLNFVESANSLDKFHINTSSMALSIMNATLVGYPTRYFIQGGFEFSDLMLQGEPNKTFFLLFSSNALSEQPCYNYEQNTMPNEIIIKRNVSGTMVSSYYFYVPVSLRNCVDGEILQNLTKPYLYYLL